MRLDINISFMRARYSMPGRAHKRNYIDYQAIPLVVHPLIPCPTEHQGGFDTMCSEIQRSIIGNYYEVIATSYHSALLLPSNARQVGTHFV